MLTEAAMSCAARRDVGHSVREAWRGIADPGPAERLAASLARHPEIKVTSHLTLHWTLHTPGLEALAALLTGDSRGH